MSKQQQRLLIDQVAGIIVQANASLELMFTGKHSADVYGTAGSNLDNILAIIGQYRACLSVPQTLCNSQAAHIDLEETGRLYPDVAAQAKTCTFNPYNYGEDALVDLANTDQFNREGAMRQIFERESIAAKVQVFTVPKDMPQQDLEMVCEDLKLIVNSYQQSWESFYHDPDDEENTDEDRMGFHGAVRWVLNLVEELNQQAYRNAPSIDSASVPKAGAGLLKPPGAALN